MGELMRVPSKRLERIPEGTTETDIFDGEIVDGPGKEVALPNREIVPVDRSPEPYIDIQPIIEPEYTPLPPSSSAETTVITPPAPRAIPLGISGPVSPVTPPRPPEVSPPNEEFTIVALDRSRDARDFARDVADKRLTEKLNADKEKSGLKGFALNVYNNLRRDVLRQREIVKAEKEIRESGDVLIGLVGDADDRLYAEQSLKQRFSNTEFGDEVLMKAAGEKREIHEQDTPYATSLKGAIHDYINSTDPKAREVFDEEVKRINDAHLKEVRSRDGEKDKTPFSISVDNIGITADAMKVAIENGASQENIFNNLNIITGEARTGAKTEARYDAGDKVAERFRKLGVAVGLAPEASVLAASYVTSVTKFFGTGLATVAGAALPGLLGGVIAGRREWRNLNLERNQNARERATGGEIDPTDKRRLKIEEKGGYNLENTSHIIGTLQAQLDLISPAPGEPAPSQDALEAAFKALAIAEFRNNIKGKDLLNGGGHVTKNGTVEDFAMVRGRLKVALRNGLDPTIRANLGFDPDMDIDELIADKSKSLDQIALLDKSMDEADKSFLKLKMWESSKTGVIGGLAAGLGAVGAQELAAMLPFKLDDILPSWQLLQDATPNIGTEKTGLIEELWKDAPDDVHQTVLADWFGPDYGGSQTAVAEAVVSLGVDGKPSVKMNGVDVNFRVETNVDGTLKVLGQDNMPIVDNVKVNADGSLSSETLTEIRKQGVDFKPEKPASGRLVDIPAYQQEVSLDKYMESHKQDTMHVKRNFMHNGSPTTPNGSELGLWSEPVSPDGTYHFNITNMENSAYDSNGKVINVDEAVKKGTVKYLISPDKGFQTEPIVVNALPDGSLDVSPGSPAAPFLGTGPNGESIVTGAYLEAVNVTGEIDPVTGAQKVDVLATVEGNQSASGRPVMDTIVGEKKEVFDARFTVNVTTEGPEMITDTPVYTAAMPLNPMKPIREQESPQRPETTRPGSPIAPSPVPPEDTPPTPPLIPKPGTGIDRLPPVPPLDRRPVGGGFDTAPVPTSAPSPAVGGRERVVRSGGELESGAYRRSNRRRRAISTSRPVTPIGSTRPQALPPGRGPEIYRNRGTTGKESIYGGIDASGYAKGNQLELTVGSPRGLPKTLTSRDRRVILRESRIFSKAVESMDRKAAVEYLRRIYGNGFELDRNPETKKWVVRPSLAGQKYRHASLSVV